MLIRTSIEAAQFTRTEGNFFRSGVANEKLVRCGQEQSRLGAGTIHREEPVKGITGFTAKKHRSKPRLDPPKKNNDIWTPHSLGSEKRAPGITFKSTACVGSTGRAPPSMLKSGRPPARGIVALVRAVPGAMGAFGYKACSSAFISNIFFWAMVPVANFWRRLSGKNAPRSCHPKM